MHFVQRDSRKTNKETKFVSSFPSKCCVSCSSSGAEEKRSKYYFDTAKVQRIWECCWVTAQQGRQKAAMLVPDWGRGNCTACFPSLQQHPALQNRQDLLTQHLLLSEAQTQLIERPACREQVWLTGLICDGQVIFCMSHILKLSVFTARGFWVQPSLLTKQSAVAL